MPTSFPNQNAPATKSHKAKAKAAALDPLQDVEALRSFFKLFRLKWALCVMAALASAPPRPVLPRPLRRHELDDQIPDVSSKVLTSTLRQLQSAGLVHKEIFAVVPVRVEYSLTEQGRQILQPLSHLESWCRKNGDVLDEANTAKT